MPSPNANTPTPGTGAVNLGSAASSIEGLLSDDFTIGDKAAPKRNTGTSGNAGGNRNESRGQTDEQHEEGDEHEGDEHDEGDEGDGTSQHGQGDEGDGDNDGDGDNGEGDESGESEGDGESDSVPDDTELTVPGPDGKEVKVSLGELKKGFLRQADYTRKTMELATERKTLGTEIVETRNQRAQLKATLEATQSLMQTLTPQEPTQAEWDHLQQTNPGAWAVQREQWRTWKEQIGGIVGQHRQLTAQQQAENQKQLKDRFAVEGQKLKEAFPQWKDAKVGDRERTAIKNYALELGYTPEEIATTIDHRIFVMAYKAQQYDELMAKRGTLKPNTQGKTSTKIVRPGSRQDSPAPNKRKSVTEARQRLQKSGNIRDAASLLEKLL